MRDAIVFFAVVFLGGSALFVGSRFPSNAPNVKVHRSREAAVPSIGSVQILNGCGVSDAAGRTADYLRRKGFDVKSNGIGNAQSFNYTQTYVLSRTQDMSVARQVGEALGIARDRVLLVRQSPDHGFDVTVIVGSDIEGILK